MSPINCKINCINLGQEIAISTATVAIIFVITDTKHQLNQDYLKLMQQLKLGFKRIINWNIIINQGQQYKLKTSI